MKLNEWSYMGHSSGRCMVTVRLTHLEPDAEAFKIVSTYSLVDTIYEQRKRNPPLPKTSPARSGI